MKRFLIALLTPILIVAALNFNVVWSVAKAKLARPAFADEKPTDPMKVTDNTLLIPAVGLQAPIVGTAGDPNAIVDWAALRKTLTQGVGLSEHFAIPGETGYTVILGHSSDVTPHRYSAIFAGLDQVHKDDTITLAYKGKAYRYKVTDKKFLLPNDPFFSTELNKKDQPNQLVLVTCWPLLTTSKRLVIVAKLI